MLKSLGYGDYCLQTDPSPRVLEEFEARLDQFRTNIAGGTFCGNTQLASKVDELLRTGNMKPNDRLLQ